MGLGEQQELETLVRGMFGKDLFLKYLRNFILFEDEGVLVKKIAGYHQFHAVLAVAESVIRASAPGGDRKGAWCGIPKARANPSRWSAAPRCCS